MESLIFDQTTVNQTIPILPAEDPWAVVKKNYKIKKLIVQGAFGSVYKAKHRTTGKNVAIKMIKEVNKHNYAARKVLRECVLLRKLS